MGIVLKLRDYIRRKQKYHGETKEAYTEIDGKLFEGKILPREAPYEIEIEEYGSKIIYKMNMDV